MESTWLVLVGATAGVVALGLLAGALGTSVLQRRAVRHALRAAEGTGLAPTDLRAQQLATPFVRRVVLPALGGLADVVKGLRPGEVIARLDDELVHAGSPAGWDGGRVFALKLASGAALIVLGLLLATGSLGGLRALALTPVTGFVGYYLPEWVLRSKSGGRQEQMRRQLPDALDLLSITVQAGLGFDAAMARVSREMGGPLGQELHRVGQELRLGKSRSEALRDLGERTTVEELQSFVLALVQAEIFGISVSRVLGVQAQELRMKRRQLAEEQAQKLTVKIIFPLVLCIMPALMVVLLGPAAINIYENFIGL